MKDKIKGLMEKDGFYIILFVCVCIVATTAVWASKNNLEKAKEERLIQEELIVDTREIENQLEKEPVLEIGKFNEEKKEVEDEKPIEKEEPEERIEEVPEPEVEETEPVKSEEMIVPIENGTIGVDFTDENLIYSNTLEEWTSHEGIDFYAAEGTTVLASGSGVVKEIYEDELWGIVIILDHGNGLLTKYASLQTNKMVNEGQKVQKGDPISKVGSTAAIEKMDKPHLHFEIIKDGIPVNPKEYIANIK